MESRKIGYIATIMTIIIGVIVILMLNGVIDFGISSSYFTKSILEAFAIPAGILACAFVLLANEEHVLLTGLDVLVAVVYFLVLIVMLFLSQVEYINFYSIYIYIYYAAVLVLALNFPFIIRTQSHIHSIYKYGLAFVIGVTAILSIVFPRNVIYSYYKEKEKINIVKYGEYLSILGIICNPMIAYASADGRGRKSKTNIDLIPNIGPLPDVVEIPIPEEITNNAQTNEEVIEKPIEPTTSKGINDIIPADISASDQLAALNNTQTSSEESSQSTNEPTSIEDLINNQNNKEN